MMTIDSGYEIHSLLTGHVPDISQIDYGNAGQKSRQAARIRDDMQAVLHYLDNIFHDV